MPDKYVRDDGGWIPYSGPTMIRHGIIKDLKDGVMTFAPHMEPQFCEGWTVAPPASAWTKCREPDETPEIHPRIKRFLVALADHTFYVRNECGVVTEEYLAVALLPSHGALTVIGNGVEFGEIRDGRFMANTSMTPTFRVVLEYIWGESGRTSRDETLLNRIAALEAECAEKTRRLDQIAAIIKGDK